MSTINKWIPEKCSTWIGVDINQPFAKPREFFAYSCSCCGFTTGEIAKDWNFCPKCGSKMKEEQ